MLRPTMVTFNNELVGLKKLVLSRGGNPAIATSRYREIGSPDVVTEGMLKWLIAKRSLTLDGNKIKTAALADIIGVSVEDVRSIIMKKGKEFTTAQVAQLRTRGIAQVRKGQEDRSTGWWERKHLSSAGKNKFCKCEVSHSFHLSESVFPSTI